MVRRFAIILFLSVWALSSAEASDQIGFTSSVDRNTVALGDTFVLTLTMIGGTRLPDPELPPFIGFDLLSDRATSSSVQIINGAMTSSVSRQYVLAPRETGDFVIGAATLRYRGQVYRTEPIKIRVVAQSEMARNVPGGPQNLFAMLTVDKKEVFLGEQVSLSAQLYLREIQLVGDPTHDGPGTEGFIKYDLRPRVFRKTQDGLIYEVLELPMVLFPLKAGELTISPVRWTGQIKVALPRRQRSPFSDSFFDDFFLDRYTTKRFSLATDPVTITVKPLPEEGKPVFFSGNVGKYSLEVTAKPAKLKVGEPITISARVSGKGNIEAVNAPIVTGIENFKSYEPEVTTNIIEKEPEFIGEKRFETILVPENLGRQVIRNVRFSFFDPEKAKYVTLAKGPFEFDVLPAPVEPIRRMVEVETGPGKTEIKVIGEDIGPIFTEMGRPGKPEPVSGTILYCSIAVPTLAYAALLAMVTRKRRLASDVAFARRKRATRDARRRLAAATKALKHGDGAIFYDAVAKGITGFVADKFSLPSAGLTAADVREKLESAGVPESLVNRVTGLLGACDYGKFAASDHSGNEMAPVLNEAWDALSELQRTTKAARVQKSA